MANVSIEQYRNIRCIAINSCACTHVYGVSLGLNYSEIRLAQVNFMEYMKRLTECDFCAEEVTFS